jgi:hypothetical protein
MIFIVLLCTLLGVGGIWGFIEGDTAWQCFWTLVVVAIGLSAASGMIDVFFKDKYDLAGIAKSIKQDVMESMDGKQGDNK